MPQSAERSRRDEGLAGKKQRAQIGTLVMQDGDGLKFSNPLTGKTTVHIQVDGDAFFGNDISIPSGSSFIIFSEDQYYNQEAMGAGDVLFGDNSSNKANMLWDRSTGKILIRSGTTTQAYIDTTGAITGGGGVVKIDSTGISITPDTTGTTTDDKAYKFSSSGVVAGGMYSTIASLNQIEVRAAAYTGLNSGLILEADGATSQNAQVSLSAQMGGGTEVHIYLKSEATPYIEVVSPSTRIGSASHYTNIDTNGHITFVGNATCWDDLRVPMSSTNLGGSKDPGFAKFKDDGSSSQGVFTYFFDAGTEEELYFSVQMPHGWKLGSDIYPHVHWTPTNTDTGNVIWGLEYTWANIDGTYGNTTIVTVTDAGDGTAYKHQMASFAALSGTGKTLSSMLICRLFRQAAAGGDTYNADAALLEIDFHYEMDSIGSATESAK